MMGVSRAIDLVGKRFGRLLVMERAGVTKHRRPLWLCRCDCGNEKAIIGPSLRSGRTKSCGCIKDELWKDKGGKHLLKHGMTNSKEYQVWENMKKRCDSSLVDSYPFYGGRGIKVSEDWRLFENFYRDMGPRPPGMTLDRVDVNGDYCKENCRWATIKEQANNRRSNRFVTLDGKTMTLAMWSEVTGIKRDTIAARLNLGWTVQDALSKPVRQSVRRCL